MPLYHRGLIGVWIATLAMFGAGVAWEILPFLVLPFFVVWLISGLTVRRVSYEGVLLRPLLYRVLLGAMLASSLTTSIAAGGTVIVVPASPTRIVGFCVLGTLNLVLAIASFRALIRPHARKAALIGMVACITEMFAIGVDLWICAAVGGLSRPASDVMLVTVAAAMITIGAGALACIAALAAFRPDAATTLPAAHVIAENR